MALTRNPLLEGLGSNQKQTTANEQFELVCVNCGVIKVLCYGTWPPYHHPQSQVRMYIIRACIEEKKKKKRRWYIA